MNHTELINYIIHKKGYKTYLEIGTEFGWNYDAIDIESKECCDPDNSGYHEITYNMPSDEMFTKININKTFDIIFIDGMHDEEYVDRDIINSLKHLNPGGIICVHDTIVKNAISQVTYENANREWNGNTWKSITKLQDNNLEFYTILNNDWGLTIIKYKENPYSLTIPIYNSKIRYNYIFNNTDDFNTCLTPQGKFVMHVISEDQLDSIL